MKINNSIWDFATVLQKFDNLEISTYMKYLISLNLEKEIAKEEVLEKLLKCYERSDKVKDKYFNFKTQVMKNKLGIKDKETLDKAEADIVSAKIALLANEENFEFSIDYFMKLHDYLFCDIYDFAGTYRVVNIEKPELALMGLSIAYSDKDEIEEKLKIIFDNTKNIDLTSLKYDDLIEFVSKLITLLWETHPFRDGNTRTVILFVMKYLESHNIKCKKEMFVEHFEYFRRSLVAACYEDIELGVYKNDGYLKIFLNDLLKDNTRLRL